MFFMVQFAVAYNKLSRNDSGIFKEVDKKKCDWSDNLFSMKKNGKRELSDFSPKGINEKDVIESTFKVLGHDPYTGDKIST